MRIQTILTRVEKFESFIYGEARLEVRDDGSAEDLAVWPGGEEFGNALNLILDDDQMPLDPVGSSRGSRVRSSLSPSMETLP